jgi:hypothetical protein
MLYYNMDNDSETKTLIPMVVLNDSHDDVVGDVEIKLILGEYGGLCVNESGACVPEISFTASGINRSTMYMTCAKIDSSDCLINMLCEACDFDEISKISIVSEENRAYAWSL